MCPEHLKVRSGKLGDELPSCKATPRCRVPGFSGRLATRLQKEAASESSRREKALDPQKNQGLAHLVAKGSLEG
jgi:hypothetical protein